MNSGYFQIPLDDKSKELTGINIDGRGYVFNSLPQGMSCSPSIFQTLMMDTLDPILWDKCICYLDDICVYGETFESCLENTIEALKLLDEKGFKLKTKKCNFFDTSIELLGNKIENNTLSPLDKHLDAIKNLKPPKTYKQLRAIIGTLNYQRRRIKNFSKVILPLTDILKGIDSTHNGKLKEWTSEHEACFEKMKELLLTKPILHIFNSEMETFLEVDASAYALGAVLYQRTRGTTEKRIIGYFSQKLPENKRHLCSFDLELLAITTACRFFRFYLIGQKFVIFTDHMPLIYQHRFDQPDARLARLISKLGEFTFEVRHISGKKNYFADFLSRYPTDALVFEEGNLKKINVMTRSKGNKNVEKPNYKVTRSYNKRKKTSDVEINDSSDVEDNDLLEFNDVNNESINDNLINDKVNAKNNDNNLSEKGDDLELIGDEFFEPDPKSKSTKKVDNKTRNKTKDAVTPVTHNLKLTDSANEEISEENFAKKQKRDPMLHVLIKYLKFKKFKNEIDDSTKSL